MMTVEADDPSGLLRASVRREATAHSGEIARLRGLFTDWARLQRIPNELVEDMRLAVDEAVSNVVMHAYPPGTTGTVTLDMHNTGDAVVVEVRDTGRWRDGPSRPEGGRGVQMMRALAPEATITSSPTGTTVRLAWPWNSHR
jgi:anti-sigma regulatory factor (Ser/Thr protein kinase)